MRIGIIGGGQLGLMMAEAAHSLNHFVIGLDPIKDCPLSTVADSMIIANYNDLNAFDKLANLVDVITYEFENVDLDLIEKYIQKIPQKSSALRISKNRFLEKTFAVQSAIPTVKFELMDIQKDIFYPSIVKTTTGGYDGKGQFKLQSQNDVDNLRLNSESSYIIEELFHFDYEISVISTRGFSGEIIHFPIPKNTHKEGILFTCEITNDLPKEVCDKAIQYSELIASQLDYVGTIAVEYFVKNNQVYFNEFAPRPHNSGHYTIEGCNVSQFENHIRAITNDRLISPMLINNTWMINVLGQDDIFIERMNPTICTYHNYNKHEKKLNRKMGHITCVDENEELLEKTIEYIKG